jgi:hypothetical protein
VQDDIKQNTMRQQNVGLSWLRRGIAACVDFVVMPEGCNKPAFGTWF